MWHYYIYRFGKLEASSTWYDGVSYATKAQAYGAAVQMASFGLGYAPFTYRIVTMKA